MVDDFLATAFHFGIFALHRGKIEIFGTRARSLRRGRAAAQADEHGRAAQDDD